jgi:hypothetical protein
VLAVWQAGGSAEVELLKEAVSVTLRRISQVAERQIEGRCRRGMQKVDGRMHMQSPGNRPAGA